MLLRNYANKYSIISIRAQMIVRAIVSHRNVSQWITEKVWEAAKEEEKISNLK